MLIEILNIFMKNSHISYHSVEYHIKKTHVFKRLKILKKSLSQSTETILWHKSRNYKNTDVFVRLFYGTLVIVIRNQFCKNKLPITQLQSQYDTVNTIHECLKKILRIKNQGKAILYNYCVTQVEWSKWLYNFLASMHFILYGNKGIT